MDNELTTTCQQLTLVEVPLYTGSTRLTLNFNLTTTDI